MNWTKNKLILSSVVLIILSLIVLTILDQTIYVNLGFKIAAILQFVGIVLFSYNLFIQKRETFRKWREKKKDLK